MAPEDRKQPAPYDDATDINTNRNWLRNPTNGQPILGDGVEARPDDLTGYAAALGQISQNFTDLARSVVAPMRNMVDAAFPVDMANGLKWTEHFKRVAGHNAGQLQLFVGNVGFGVHNVASAAQVVADAYRNTDETSAATLNAVLFAFSGDEKLAPGSLPEQYVKEVPTWDEFRRDNPAATTVVPTVGLRPEDVTTTTSGNTTTTIVKLPDGGEMKIVTENWSTYPGGPSGYTQTTYINGQAQTIQRSSSSYGAGTTVENTQVVYDQHGKEQRRQVTSVEETQTTVNGTTAQTDRRTTTYTYDSEGNRTDESQTQSSEAVGAERFYEPAAQPGDDPVDQELAKLRPQSDEPVILAPGAFDQPGGGQTSPGTTTV